MSFLLPVGFDRGDGVTPLPQQPAGSGGAPATFGTPNTPQSVIVQSGQGTSNLIPQNELPDSPVIERAEQATFSHSFIMSWQDGVGMMNFLGRGVFVEDSGLSAIGIPTTWRILSSKITALRGGFARIDLVAESISFDSPPDDFQILQSDLGLNIINNPRYFYALYPQAVNQMFGNQNDYSVMVGTPPNQATVAQVKQAIIRAIQTYQDAPFFPSSNAVNGLVQNSIIQAFITGNTPITSGSGTTTIATLGNPACALANAAASEIIQKLWKQEENPYIPGFKIVWTQYYFSPPYLNPGAYIEDPVGIVPDYFLSPSQDGSNTIFDLFPQINPQDFSTTGDTSGDYNISWLRQADEINYQRTWFAISRTWIGSPVGLWDPQIFSGGNRPTSPSDYLPLV